jgi:hypothetical protein
VIEPSSLTLLGTLVRQPLLGFTDLNARQYLWTSHPKGIGHPDADPVGSAAGLHRGTVVSMRPEVGGKIHQAYLRSAGFRISSG